MARKKTFVEKALYTLISNHGAAGYDTKEGEHYVSSTHVEMFRPKSSRMKNIFALTDLERSGGDNWDEFKKHLEEKGDYKNVLIGTRNIKEALELFDGDTVTIRVGGALPIMLIGEELEIFIAPRVEDEPDDDFDVDLDEEEDE